MKSQAIEKIEAQWEESLILEPGSVVITEQKPEALIRLEAERDIYKELYMELLRERR